MREKVIMNKQEYVVRPHKKEPLYVLNGVDDLKISDLYKVKINGKEETVYGNEFFHFMLPVFAVEQEALKDMTLCVEVTVLESFESVRMRPSSCAIEPEREKDIIPLRFPLINV